MIVGSARLRFPGLVAVLATGAVVAVLAAVGGGVLPALFAAMVVGSLSAAPAPARRRLGPGQGPADRDRSGQPVLPLGAAFGPAIAAAGA